MKFRRIPTTMFSLKLKPNLITFAANLIISFILTQVNSNDICLSEKKATKYHLIEKCHRSKLGILVKANVSLLSCQKLGIEKKGLALNFSPPEAGGVEYSCEVLKCAESDGGYSLENDTYYDYYSIYGKPLREYERSIIPSIKVSKKIQKQSFEKFKYFLAPDVNSTCVPGIGMLHLLPKRRNFTEARAECRNRSSSLADVASEQRTEALAQLLTGAGVEAVYVGLRRRNSTVFVGDNGKSLDCTTYRAWAPGHPRRNYTKFDCALITKNRMWISTPCAKRHPVLCELKPGGPYRRGTIFQSRPKIINDTLAIASTIPPSEASDPNN